MAQLKELESRRALRSMMPSREMFGPGGAEEVITGVRGVPAESREIPIEESEREEPMIGEGSENETPEVERTGGNEGDGDNNALLTYMLLNKRRESGEEAATATEGEASEGEKEATEGTEAAESGGFASELEAGAEEAAEVAA